MSKKITEYTLLADASVATDDVIPIVDVTADETKKVKLKSLIATLIAASSGSGSGSYGFEDEWKIQSISGGTSTVSGYISVNNATPLSVTKIAIGKNSTNGVAFNNAMEDLSYMLITDSSGDKIVYELSGFTDNSSYCAYTCTASGSGISSWAADDVVSIGFLNESGSFSVSGGEEGQPLQSDGSSGWQFGYDHNYNLLESVVPTAGSGYANISGTMTEDILYSGTGVATLHQCVKFLTGNSGAPSYGIAKNTDTDEKFVMGLYVHNSSIATAGYAARILHSGFVKNSSWSFSTGDIGKNLYVGSDGALTATKPTAAANYVQVVGRIVAPTVIHFNPSSTVITNS